jgi:PAS domain S-box-containing protein
MRRTIRLRTVLAVFFISLSLMPLALFGSLTAYITASYFTRQFTATSKQITDAVTSRLEDFLSNAERLVRHLGDTVVRSGNQGVVAYMDSLRFSFPYYESFHILDDSGALIMSSPPDPDLIGYDMSRTSYFQNTGVMPSFSKPYISGATGKMTMTVSYRRREMTIAGTMNLVKLREIVTTFYEGGTGTVIITDSTGNVIAHPDPDIVLQRYNFSDRPYIRAARNGAAGIVSYSRDGEKYLATVTVMPSTGWIIAVTQRKWDALWYLRSFLLILAAVVLSSIGTALIISYALGKKILTPLNVLRRSSNRLAAGNYLETREEVRYEELSDVINAFNRMSRAISHREEELTRSRERYRALIEHANSIIIRWDTDLKYTFFNEYAQEFFGYSEAEVLGKSVIGITVPEEESSGRDLEAMVGDILLHPEDYKSNQNEVITRQGERRWIQWSNRPIYDDAGKLVEILSIGTDRTEYHTAEERINRSLHEKEILLKEIHHRVKNNMQIISSLLNLQAESMHDPRDIELFRESQNRVHSMALVHEQLYQSENLAEIDLESFVQDLISYLADTYLGGDDEIRFALDVKNGHMEIDQAVPCALILGELVSNAIKYAFPNRPKKGTIEVGIEETRRESPAGENYAVRITVRDDGIGMDEPERAMKTAGMGLQLVSALVQQMKGKLSIEGGGTDGIDSGTVVTIELEGAAVGSERDA